MADVNPFEAAMQEPEDPNANPFEVAQAESAKPETAQPDPFDPFDEIDPKSTTNKSSNNNNNNSTVTTSSNNNNNNNNSGNTDNILDLMSTTTADTNGKSSNAEAVAAGAAGAAGAGTAVSRPSGSSVSKASPGTRAGRCCTCFEHNTMMWIEIFLIAGALVCTFAAVTTDNLAIYHNSSLKHHCGVTDCEYIITFGGYYDSYDYEDSFEYSERCDDGVNSMCDTSARAFFWFIFNCVSVFLSGFVIFVYLRGECRPLQVECPSCKCCGAEFALSRRRCLYIILFDLILLISAVCVWCINNVLFQNDEALVFDIGTSIWLDFGAILLLVFGLLHGAYQKEVFAKDR